MGEDIETAKKFITIDAKKALGTAATDRDFGKYLDNSMRYLKRAVYFFNAGKFESCYQELTEKNKKGNYNKRHEQF